MRRIASALFSLLLVAASCGGSDGAGITAVESGGAVSPEAAFPAGTPIADGFEVADGTVLIVTAMPAAIDGPEFGGWVAHLALTGDPRAVVDAYLAQAEALGFEREPEPSGQPEFLQAELPPEQQQHTTCGQEAAHGGPSAWACRAMARTAGSAPCVMVDVRRSADVDRPESLLLLTLRRDPAVCSAPFVPLSGDPDAPAPPVPAWSELPEEGEALGDRWGPLAAITVESGSAVAAQPLLGPCPAALVVVTATDAARVADRYVAQLETIAPQGTTFGPIESEVEGGALRSTGRLVPAGGPSFSAVLFTPVDGDPLLRLTECDG